MAVIIVCFIFIGCFIGFIFTLFLINFDGRWKLLLEALLGIGGSGISIVAICDFYEITVQSQKFIATSSFILGFFISVILSLFILCYIIKDKDDSDILRIRDILLGQKSYIEKYYENRKKEIEDKLPSLEEREKDIINKEHSLEAKQRFVESEQNKLELLGNKKLKFNLPENKSIIINKEFIEMLPSYIADLSKCISDIKNHTENFIEKENIDLNELKSYFMSVAIFIAQDFFGGKSNDIRVHFRYYNEDNKKYEKLIAIMGNQIITKNMTPIPFENSMIKKSFECRRALIKSINSDYDFRGDNYTVWKDYMTFAFYNLKREGIPFLTFGISVKNETRFKYLFYFLNYFRLEEYLEEHIEQINERFNIESILY